MNIGIPSSEAVKSLYCTQKSCLQLTLKGDLKSTTTAALHRDIFAVLDHESARTQYVSVVELDITGASMVDSLGLNLIIAVLKWSQQRGAKLRVLVGKRGVYSTMLAVGLERQSEVINSEA